jgi:hypothetical protein
LGQSLPSNVKMTEYVSNCQVTLSQRKFVSSIVFCLVIAKSPSEFTHISIPIV